MRAAPDNRGARASLTRRADARRPLPTQGEARFQSVGIGKRKSIASRRFLRQGSGQAFRLRQPPLEMTDGGTEREECASLAEVAHLRSSPPQCTLTRARGAASPATERARRITSGAGRDTLTWERGSGAVQLCTVGRGGDAPFSYPSELSDVRETGASATPGAGRSIVHHRRGGTSRSRIFLHTLPRGKVRNLQTVGDTNF